MAGLDINEPVQKLTYWVNGLVVVVEKPNGKLRVCLDSRPLNKAIKCEHLHLPTVEEVFSQMSGGCFFFKTRHHFRLLSNQSSRRAEFKFTGVWDFLR